MKALRIALTVAVAVALAAVGTAFAASRAATVSTARTGLGRVVVNGSGRTLYLFAKDKHGRSACSGTCTVYWPPLLTKGKPAAMSGVKRSLLGTIKRSDGGTQVTLAGHPLYVFSGDTKRGETNGEGLQDFGAGWYALTPAGTKIDRD